MAIASVFALGCSVRGEKKGKPDNAADEPESGGDFEEGGDSVVGDESSETAAPEPAPTPEPAAEEPGTSKPTADDPGPAPANSCGLTKGALFMKNGAYVGAVPSTYDGKPTRLVVGLSGCGDDPWNFLDWAIAPGATRATQSHIGIVIDRQGAACGDLDAEAAKVLAAIDELSKCLYVHKQKVVIAGHSLGGAAAYAIGLKHADRFAGILVETGMLGWAGDADARLAAAKWKINVAHRAHLQDSSAPIADVRAEWANVKAKGFALQTSEVAGTDEGTSADWSEWLLPRMETWRTP